VLIEDAEREDFQPYLDTDCEKRPIDIDYNPQYPEEDTAAASAGKAGLLKTTERRQHRPRIAAAAAECAAAARAAAAEVLEAEVVPLPAAAPLSTSFTPSDAAGHAAAPAAAAQPGAPRCGGSRTSRGASRRRESLGGEGSGREAGDASAASAADKPLKFRVALRRSSESEGGPTQLGLDTEALRGFAANKALSEKGALRVTLVREGGLVSAWNKAHRRHRIRAGDLIVEVNRLRGGPQDLCAAISNSSEIELEIVRFPTATPRSASTSAAPTPRDPLGTS